MLQEQKLPSGGFFRFWDWEMFTSQSYRRILVTHLTNKILMTNYTKRGSRIMVGKDADSITYPKLPGGTYTVQFSEMVGYYLEEISDFTLPAKVYGDCESKAERILSTFSKRPAATGVHLDGVKGSGKTLLVKAICSIGRELYAIPTIVINAPYHGDDFNAFIQSIDTPSIIVFDEFEKTYNWETQTKILTLFDGVYPSQKLFLLTTNKSHECSEFLKNRPGRMYYSLSYDVMDIATVREVLEDQLRDKEQIPSIIKYAEVFTFLNFDMLIAIVEEMNRYNETLQDVLEMLNVQPEMRHNEQYSIDIIVNEQEPYHIETTHGYDPNNWSDHLESRDIVQAAKPVRERNSHDDDDGDDGYEPSISGDTQKAMDKVFAQLDGDDNEYVRVGPSNLVSFDGGKGIFTYNVTFKREKVVVTITRDERDFNTGGIFNMKNAF